LRGHTPEAARKGAATGGIGHQFDALEQPQSADIPHQRRIPQSLQPRPQHLAARPVRSWQRISSSTASPAAATMGVVSVG